MDNYCVPLEDEKRWENLKLVKLTKAGFNKYLADFQEKWADYSCPIGDELLKDMFLTGLGKLKLKECWEIHLNKSARLSKCIPILQLLENQIKNSEAVQALTGTTNSTPVNHGDLMELEAIITSLNALKKNSPAWNGWCKKNCACYTCSSKKHCSANCDHKGMSKGLKDKEAVKPKN